MRKVILAPLTRVNIRRANARGAATASAPTALVSADVAKVEGAFHLRLQFRDGTRLSVPTNRIEELGGVRALSVRKLEIASSGDSISFPALDVDIYVPGLLRELYGSQILAENGRIGGKISSPAKTAAVRLNGRKGGRPRKELV